MKLIIQRESLVLALSAVNKSASIRTSLPILKNVLLKAEKSKLYLSTTDLENSIKVEIPADVQKEGATTVLAKTFFEYVSSLNTDILNLELVNSNLEITGVGNKAKLLIIPPDEFPVIPKTEGKPVFSLSSSEFISSLDKVLFAASLDESRQVITGILFEVKKDALNLVGVDGYRLSKKTIAIKSQKELNLIIPSKALSEMVRIVSENKSSDEGEVKIFLLPDGNNVSFLFNGVELVTRLIEGDFPDYKRIIPTEFTTNAFISTEDFSNSLKTINVFTRASTSSSRISMNFNAEESKATLSTSLAQVGENTVDIEAEIKGDSGEIFFNIKYLTDLLSHVKSSKLLICLSIDKPFPCIVKEIVDENVDESYLHMIMPMSVK